MQFINYLLDATDAILPWEISRQGFGDAMKAHACLMAGIHLDDLSDTVSDCITEPAIDSVTESN